MNKKIIRLKRFGQYLRQRRIKAGLTQSQVAGKLKYTTGQFISNWETGRSSPPLEVLHRIANLYAIPPQELFQVLMQQHQESLAQALKLKRPTL